MVYGQDTGCKVIDRTDEYEVKENGIPYNKIENLELKCTGLDDSKIYQIQVVVAEGSQPLTKTLIKKKISDFKISEVKGGTDLSNDEINKAERILLDIQGPGIETLLIINIPLIKEGDK